MTSEWSEWREHDGAGRPVPIGTIVHVIHKDPILGETDGGIGPCEDSYSWHIEGYEHFAGEFWCPIIRYRVKL